MTTPHIKLGIDFLGALYHLLWINPNPDKKELFIQFISNPRTRGINIEAYKDGKLQFTNGFYDHLSIHNDGKAHVRTKAKGKRKEYVQELDLGHSIYDMKLNKVLPILSNTYNIHIQPEFFTKMTKEETLTNTHLWQTKKQGIFTMLIFLAQRNNSENFCNDYIKNVLKIRSTPILIDLGNNFHCLIVLLTAKIPLEYKGYLQSQIQMTDIKTNYLPSVSFGIFPTIAYLENGLVAQ